MVKTGDWLSEAWEMISGNIVTHIILTLIVTIGSSVTGGLLAGPLVCGYLWIAIQQIKDQSYEPQIGDVGKGFENFLQTFLVGIVGGLIGSIGGVLCGIGAILTAPLVLFAFPLVAEQKMGFWDAIMDSINTVKQSYGAWIVFALVLGLINMAGGLVAIGWIITYPITIVAVALAYRDTYGVQGAAGGAGPSAPQAPSAPQTPEPPSSPTPQ
jgi:uncharacterized membrane protein